MLSIKRYVRLYRVFISQFLKSLMQSKLDFWIGLLGFLLSQTFGIVFLYLVFEQIPSLQKWTLEQLVFIYGFAQIPRGLDHLITDNIWMVGWKMVITGEFDKYMLRPMNLFFQVICEKLQPDALGELLVGVVLTTYSFQKGLILLTPGRLLLFLLSILAGSVIYTSVKLFFASLAFWFKDSIAMLQVAYDMANFAKYPIEIYAKPIQFVISYIIPFAFVAYYPASYFLMAAGPWETIGMECILAVIAGGIAYLTFVTGTRRYESAGN